MVACSSQWYIVTYYEDESISACGGQHHDDDPHGTMYTNNVAYG